MMTYFVPDPSKVDGSLRDPVHLEAINHLQPEFRAVHTRKRREIHKFAFHCTRNNAEALNVDVVCTRSVKSGRLFLKNRAPCGVRTAGSRHLETVDHLKLFSRQMLTWFVPETDVVNVDVFCTRAGKSGRIFYQLPAAGIQGGLHAETAQRNRPTLYVVPDIAQDRKRRELPQLK